MGDDRTTLRDARNPVDDHRRTLVT